MPGNKLFPFDELLLLFVPSFFLLVTFAVAWDVDDGGESGIT